MNSLKSWRNGVVTAYAGSGLVFATWVSRIPAIKVDLGLTPGTVGLMLLCMSFGSFISVAASGLVVLRLGSKLTTKVCIVIQSSGVVIAGVGASLFSSPWVVGAGLILVGLGTGSANAASNIEGSALERAMGRHIMPRLHGSFSIGTVVGAALGAVAVSLNIPVGIHLSLMAVVVGVAVFRAAGYYQADQRAAEVRSVRMVDTADKAAVESGDTQSVKADGKAKIAAAWRDPRTLMLGILVLGLGLAEGAAGDWIALALTDGYRSSKEIGAIGYGIFVTAMTVGRFAGTLVLDKFGRVVVLRVSAATAIVGLAVFVFSPNVQVALVSLLFWGLGSALGFPVAMSAASDDPLHAAARVSVVSTIGYGAFLGGPPLLGLLGEHVGIRHSLLAVLVMVVVSFILTPNVRKPASRAQASVEG